MPFLRTSYRILGIDPGSQKFGAAILDVRNDRAEFTDLVLVKVKGRTFGERLLAVEQELRGLIQVHMPEIVTWEAPFYNFGTRNADACIQLSKAVGITERLCPQYSWIERGYECQPSSSRKVLGVSQANYFGLREALSTIMPTFRDKLWAGVDQQRKHDDQPAATIGCDSVSAMVQAYATWKVLADNLARKGIEPVYTRYQIEKIAREKRCVTPPPG